MIRIHFTRREPPLALILARALHDWAEHHTGSFEVCQHFYCREARRVTT